MVKSIRVRLALQVADLDLLEMQAVADEVVSVAASAVEVALVQRIHRSLPSNMKALDNTFR